MRAQGTATGGPALWLSPDVITGAARRGLLTRRVRSLPARDQREAVNQSVPAQGAMPWIIAVEVDACGGERGEYLSLRRGAERAIMLAGAAVDAPSADQAVADNSDDGRPKRLADTVIAALSQQGREPS